MCCSGSFFLSFLCLSLTFYLTHSLSVKLSCPQVIPTIARIVRFNKISTIPRQLRTEECCSITSRLFSACSSDFLIISHPDQKCFSPKRFLVLKPTISRFPKSSRSNNAQKLFFHSNQFEPPFQRRFRASQIQAVDSCSLVPFGRIKRLMKIFKIAKVCDLNIEALLVLLI